MTYLRLNFENPRGGEPQRSQRFMKGLGRELATPAGSIPYSTEGSTAYENIDKSIIIGAVKNRNEMAAIIRKYEPLARLRTAKLFFNKDTYLMLQSANISFDESAPMVKPGVST